MTDLTKMTTSDKLTKFAEELVFVGVSLLTLGFAVIPYVFIKRAFLEAMKTAKKEHIL